MKKKKIIKNVLSIIVIVILLSVTFGVMDYNNVREGNKPMFMVRITDGSKSTQKYIGLGYKLIREVGVSYKEELATDSKIEFGTIFNTWEIKINK